MADQTQRLEIATVRAEVGSNIVYRFANDAVGADQIPTQSGPIQNLKQVILEIQEDASEKISISTTIYPTVAAGLAASADQEIFLVQSNDADEIYTVWKNEAGTAVNTGKTALSATAIQTALDASNEAAQAAEDAADVATTRTAGFLAPSATAPVLRDNGLPLQPGDRYFNTTDQAEYIYKTDGWEINDSIEAIAEIEDATDPAKGAAKVGFDGGTVADALKTAKPLASYAALRAYTGPATRAILTGEGIAGAFSYKASWPVGENFGTVIVGTDGRKWVREGVEHLNVRWFGAAGDGTTDDASAFQAAVDALPTTGGTIDTPDANYSLSVAPSEGSKSILWNIGAGSVFSGAGTGQGKFPYMLSNTAQMAVGPYIRSRSAQHSTHPNGGIAAFNVEMIQPADYVGQSVAGYFGAIGSNPTAGANVWAINALIRAQAGAKGIYQCIEVDVDNFSADAQVKGISISGSGTSNPEVAFEAVRAGVTAWKTGVSLHKCIAGIKIFGDAPTVIGIIVGNPAAQINAVLSGQQLADGHDGILLQRFSDTSATGSFFRAVNAANSQVLARIDINGAYSSVAGISTSASMAATQGFTSTSGNVRGVTIEATGIATASTAGGFRLSATTSATVGAAGSAAALPATPAKFIVVNQDGVNYKIPLYNA